MPDYLMWLAMHDECGLGCGSCELLDLVFPPAEMTSICDVAQDLGMDVDELLFQVVAEQVGT